MAENYWGNTARAVLGQGLAMGWGDELEARIRTMSGDETYDEELNAINESYGQFAEENPGTALTGELVGGFAPLALSYLGTGVTGGAAAPAAIAQSARMASTLNKLRQAGQTASQLAKSSKVLNNPLTNNPLTRTAARGARGTGRFATNNPIGRGMTAGSTTGFVDGAGRADVGERLEGGAWGAGFGATMGLAVPITGRTAKAGWNWLKERVYASGATIDEGALRRLFNAVQARGGTIQDVVDQIDADRRLGIDQSTISNATPALNNQAEMVVAAARGDAPLIIEDELIKMQAAARDNAAKQVKKQLGNTNYYAEQDALLARLRSNAKGFYDEAYAFGAVDDPRILALLADDDNFKAAYKRAQAIAKTERSAAKLRGEPEGDFTMVDLDIEGAIPDVRTLDYIKRGIDDVLRKGFDNKGGGLGPTEAAALKNLKNDFLNVLDEATEIDGVSAYRNARKAYKGDIEVLESMEQGLKEFQNLAPEEVAKMLKNFSTAEADTFVLGATRSILNKITKPRGNSNYALNTINSPDDLKKLRMLFPEIGPSGFDLLNAALQRESQIYKQTNKVLGGSPTQKRKAGVAAMEEGEAIGSALATGVESVISPGPALLRIVSNTLRSAKMPAKIQEKMAKMLMSSKPDDVAAAVQALENFAAKNKPKVINLNAREVLATSGVANLTSTNPSEGPKTSRSAAR